MRKIIDSFIFYNEVDMLKFRFAELNDVVDYFVLVESPLTFQRNPKELFYEKNKEMFKEYEHKIIHVIVNDHPEDENPWINERYQRRCIDRGLLRLNLKEDDIILISDVDEIFDTSFLKNIKENGLNSIISCNFDMYYYNLKCKTNELWIHPKVVPFSYYKKFERRPDYIRQFQNIPIIQQKNGWHFSYFGDAERIANKIHNFSHQEYNLPEHTNIETINKNINEGNDLFKRGDIKIEKINTEDNKYLPKNYKMLL